MPVITPSKYSLELAQALRDRGLFIWVEHWDGHKHVDICIPEAKINIEIDGLHHFTNPEQIEADFKREFYSEESKIDTIHIPNELILGHLDKIADAISEVAKSRLSKYKPSTL